MLSFEGIKCKQYKKYRQDKNSRNLQAFVQETSLPLPLSTSPKEDFKVVVFSEF